MKRQIRFGIWDTSREAFWLKNESDKPARLGFSTSVEARGEISKQNALGFRGLVVRKFEANREEI